MVVVSRPCVAILGGSFDPPHLGHLALARYFCSLLPVTKLQIIPAGNPWQKSPLRASVDERLEMIRLTFSDFDYPTTIDLQEINRQGPSYTVDSLRNIRLTTGEQTCIFFLLGADQLQHLNDWHHWKHLLDWAHLCIASRPGYPTNSLPRPVAEFLRQNQSSIEELSKFSHGRLFLSHDLDCDTASSTVRETLLRGQIPSGLHPAVLDYLAIHPLYKEQ